MKTSSAMRASVEIGARPGRGRLARAAPQQLAHQQRRRAGGARHVDEARQRLEQRRHRAVAGEVADDEARGLAAAAEAQVHRLGSAVAVDGVDPDAAGIERRGVQVAADPMRVAVGEQQQVAGAGLEDLGAAEQPDPATALGHDVDRHEVLGAGQAFADAGPAVAAVQAPGRAELRVQKARPVEAGRLEDVRQRVHRRAQRNHDVTLRRSGRVPGSAAVGRASRATRSRGLAGAATGALITPPVITAAAQAEAAAATAQERKAGLMAERWSGKGIRSSERRDGVRAVDATRSVCMRVVLLGSAFGNSRHHVYRSHVSRRTGLFQRPPADTTFVSSVSGRPHRL